MTIKNLLEKLGITENIIENTIGNLNTSIDRGYDIHSHDIKTFDAIQMIDIYPNVQWTDGSVRPAYSSGGVSICLNKKIVID